MPLKAQQIVSWLLVLLCITLIFGFSSQEGKQSESLSFAVTAFVMRLHGQPEPDMTTFLRFDNVIRKTAHVCEYCLLALSLLWALSTVGVGGALRFALLYAICFTLAFLDEWRQTAIPGRAGCFSDVLIDQIGVAVAALGCLLLAYFRKRKAAKI